MFLAINPGRVAGTLPGTRDHRSGLRPAGGVDRRRASASRRRSLGYTVVDRRHRGRDASVTIDPGACGRTARPRRKTQQLLEHVAKRHAEAGRGRGAQDAAAVDRAAGAAEPAGGGRAHPRHAHHRRDAGRARRRAPRIRASSPPRCASRSAASIVQQIYGPASELDVIALEPELERVLLQVMNLAGHGAGLEPGLADTLSREAAAAVAAAGRPGPAGRAAGARPAARCRWRGSCGAASPALRVLGHSEIPDARTIRVSVMVGGKR